MYTVVTTKHFERSVRKCHKRGFDLSLLNEVIDLLKIEGKLPPQYNPHKLSGRFCNAWECHIKPNWLLVWQQNDTELTLLLLDTGTHADIF
ncbi:MAG: type II toxin-antitoxin system YafQ family toxin [Bacteroidaceae bacterium]|nr:type II toxin-antitoxin system YafQ family toxin [Bacteroidaceae bacterium]